MQYLETKTNPPAYARISRRSRRGALAGLTKYLRSIRRREFLDCQTCENEAYCSICMVKNANESETGNPLEVNKYYCEIAKIKRRVVDRFHKVKL